MSIKYIKWYEWILRPLWSLSFYRHLKQHSVYCQEQIEKGKNFKKWLNSPERKARRIALGLPAEIDVQKA